MGVPLLIISSLPAVRPIMLQRLSIHLWLLASLIATAAAAPAQLLDKRQRVSVYAAGGCFESGSFSSDLKWQSSGVLTSLGARDRLAVGMRTGWKMELPDGTAGYQTNRLAALLRESDHRGADGYGQRCEPGGEARSRDSRRRLVSQVRRVLGHAALAG